MQPKYNPGDPLVLDRGVNTVETEGILFRLGKRGFIKQLQRIPTEDGLIVRAKLLNSTLDNHGQDGLRGLWLGAHRVA